jgi:hypothetical protein
MLPLRSESASGKHMYYSCLMYAWILMKLFMSLCFFPLCVGYKQTYFHSCLRLMCVMVSDVM